MILNLMMLDSFENISEPNIFISADRRR